MSTAFHFDNKIIFTTNEPKSTEKLFGTVVSDHTLVLTPSVRPNPQALTSALTSALASAKLKAGGQCCILIFSDGNPGQDITGSVKAILDRCVDFFPSIYVFLCHRIPALRVRPQTACALSPMEYDRLAESDDDFPAHILSLETLVKKYGSRDGYRYNILRFSNLVKDAKAIPVPEDTPIVLSQTTDPLCGVSDFAGVHREIAGIMKNGRSGETYHSAQRYFIYNGSGPSPKKSGAMQPLALSDHRLPLLTGAGSTLPQYPKLDPEYEYEKNYDGKLKLIQETELCVIAEIDRICKKHNIRYFLVGGSLLGAVRHKGFIPWDDDFDIGMLRRDYDKFRRIAPKELDSRFFYQSSHTENDCYFVFDKIRIKDTYFTTEFSSHFNIENGLFIDILAYDYTSPSPFWQKVHVSLLHAMKGAIDVRWLNRTDHSNHALAACILLPVMRLIPLPVYLKIFERYLTKYSRKQAKAPERYRSLIDGVGLNLTRGAFPAEWFENLVPMEFNGLTMPAPSGYDAYLRRWYGNNYMELLPSKKRVSGHIIPQMDLGRYICPEERKRTAQ